MTHIRTGQYCSPKMTYRKKLTRQRKRGSVTLDARACTPMDITGIWVLAYTEHDREVFGQIKLRSRYQNRAARTKGVMKGNRERLFLRGIAFLKVKESAVQQVMHDLRDMDLQEEQVASVKNCIE